MGKYDSNGFQVEVNEADGQLPEEQDSSVATKEKRLEQALETFDVDAWPVNDEAVRNLTERHIQEAVMRKVVLSARKHATVRAQKFMLECGIPLSTISRDIGLAPDTLFHAVNDARFTMPADALVKFCYKYLHVTLQEFLLGAPRPTLLPRFLLPVAKGLYAYQENANAGHANIYTLHALGCKIFQSKTGTEWPVGFEDCGKNSFGTFKDRVLEYADDRYMKIGNLPIDLPTKSAIRKMFVTGAPEKRGMMGSAMRCAIACGMTVDYFLAKDYTMLGTVAYLDEAGQTCVIHDRHALEIIGMLLTMPEPVQNEYFAKIVYRIMYEG